MNEPIDITLDAARRMFEAAKRIVVLTHERPDADCLGAGAALVLAGRKLGKKAFALNPDEIPDRLKPAAGFSGENDEQKDGRLPVYITGEPAESIADAVSCFNPDLIIAADTAELSLLGDYAPVFSGCVGLKIDHHPPRDNFGAFNCVDDTVSSCCEIIFRMLHPLGVIDKEIAAALYAGIIADSGNFKYPAVTADTHLAAAALIETGISHSDISERMFGKRTEKDLAGLRVALDTLERFSCPRRDGKEIGCASIFISNADKEKYSLDDADLSGLHSFARDIEGVDVGVTIKQMTDEPTKFKLSFRSSKTNVSLICEQLGGGGHARASGGAVEAESPEEAKRLIREAIERYGEPIID
ncbi:MAG TPA: bifunctional oligoribonuclease/PAP phosphatase NrnA [Clostridiales bacterium]|jgi:phosphoesterase RecJ-like protein|nr:bifunctional oligoribonuclease/PAP phosphatase NrnA [Clostridiales bacterium]